MVGKLLTVEVLQAISEFEEFPAKMRHPLENLERGVDVAGVAVVLNISISNVRNQLSVTLELIYLVTHVTGRHEPTLNIIKSVFNCLHSF